MGRSGIRAPVSTVGGVLAVVLTVGGVLAVSLTVGGCGFVESGDSPQTKPDGFPLHGYVTVAGASAGQIGSPCLAPASVTDIVAGGRVIVSSPDGENLATGELGTGVLATAPSGAGYRCNFPFRVSGVPGGQKTYVVVVGLRPAASFPAAELRADKPAVIEAG